MAREPTDIVEIKIRMREMLRAQIEESARELGVSMNNEMTQRLTASFEQEELFSSREMRLWAIIMADHFRSAGIAHASPETIKNDRWLETFQAAMPATFRVFDCMLTNLQDTMRVDHASYTKANAKEVARRLRDLADKWEELLEDAR